MGYEFYKMRKHNDDIVYLDLAGDCGTITIVASVDFANSAITTRQLTISNGIITNIGEEV